MPWWYRVLQFAFLWTLLGVAAYGACACARSASQTSPAAGYAARAGGSLGLGLLGLFVGVHDVLTLGAVVGGDYRSLLPSGWWWVLGFGATAAAVPWIVWVCGRPRD